MQEAQKTKKEKDKMNWKKLFIGLIVVFIAFIGFAMICGGSGDNTTTVVVESDGAYSGSIGGMSEGQTTIEGNGNQNFTVNDTYASCCIQKAIENPGETLTVKIVRNGQVIDEQTTTADYGVVTVSG